MTSGPTTRLRAFENAPGNEAPDCVEQFSTAPVGALAAIAEAAAQRPTAEQKTSFAMYRRYTYAALRVLRDPRATFASRPSAVADRWSGGPTSRLSRG
jgi:hypothetical protein